MLTGFAGAFYTNYMGYIDPKVVFALHDISIVTIMVVMVGGVATFWGPIVGAVIMVLLAELIRSIPMLGTAHQTFFGILLIVIIIFLPNGIVGDFPKLKKLVGLGTRRPVMSLLEVKKVSRFFGGIAAIKDVSFSVAEGRDPRAHRSERRRQDNAVQRRERILSSLARRGVFQGRDDLRPASRTRSANAAWPGPSRS